jgi:GxxExxY protein
MSHAPYARMDHEVELTERIVGCAIEVHRALGPGLLEGTYQRALCAELRHNQIKFEKNRMVPLEYRGERLGQYYVDLIVDKRVVVEIKSVLQWEPVFEAQILTYLRITGVRVGLLMNFNKAVLKAGIKRFVL